MMEGWIRLCPVSAVGEGDVLGFTVGGESVVVMRWRGKYLAFRDVCPHESLPISEGGWLENDCLVCPWHGARFRLPKGEWVDGPPSGDLDGLAVVVREGWLWVGLGEGKER